MYRSGNGMVAEAFAERCDEMENLLGAARHVLGNSGQQPASKVQQAKRDVEDVGLGLEELAQDVDKFPYNQRSKARDVLKRLQAKCGQLEFMSEGVTLSSGGGRALGGGGRRADEVPEARRALLSAQHGVDQTNESLENTLRTMDGIREAGRKTNDQLRAQRETLTSANDKIEDVNAYSVRAKKIIRTMSRRLVTDKLTQGLTIIVELLIIAAIVYWKYYS